MWDRQAFLGTFHFTSAWVQVGQSVATGGQDLSTREPRGATVTLKHRCGLGSSLPALSHGEGTGSEGKEQEQLTEPWAPPSGCVWGLLRQHIGATRGCSLRTSPSPAGSP